jgi:hypothetical protein
MGAYTKLQAINEMLLFSGETPVTSLDGSSGVDTLIADSILDQKTIDAQARGLANNITIRDVTLDVAGTIAVPTNSLSAEMITLVSAAHKDVEYARVVTRNWATETPIFYNLTDNTSIFPLGTYTYSLILNVAWTDMDTPIQKDIMVQASRQYQMLTQGDGSVDNYIAQLELYYGAKARGADTNSKGYNLFDLHKGARDAVNRNVRNDPQKFRHWNLK